jgi:AcrR family transcriptional regulator
MTEGGSTLQKLRESERDVRRNLIIDAAMRLFAHKPFDRVGIRDIAAEAGLSPASIYRYFADRDELFVEALFREGEAIESGLKDLIAGGGPVPLEKAATVFVDYLLDNDAFFQMMTHFMIDGGISDSALERFNDTERRLLRIFDDMLETLGAQGNVRLVSHAFFAALNGILITFRNYPGRKPEDTRKHMERLASIMGKIFTAGTTAID